MLIDLFQKTRTTSMQMKDLDTLPEEKPQIVCKGCGAQLQARNYGRNLYVCPSCGRYARLLARTRVRITADKDSFRELFANIRPCNPLDFEGYREKIEALQEKTGMQDAVVTGVCTVGGIETCLGIMDSHFLMASMGSVVGEKLTRLFEYATRRRLPVILFTASGGARMQEGMFSLCRWQRYLVRHADIPMQGCCISLCSPILQQAVSQQALPPLEISFWQSRMQPLGLPAAVSLRAPLEKSFQTIFSHRVLACTRIL